jgi:hypothetical protein
MTDDNILFKESDDRYTLYPVRDSKNMGFLQKIGIGILGCRRNRF